MCDEGLVRLVLRVKECSIDAYLTEDDAEAIAERARSMPAGALDPTYYLDRPGCQVDMVMQERNVLAWLHAEAVWKLKQTQQAAADASDSLARERADHLETRQELRAMSNTVARLRDQADDEYPDISGGGVPYPKPLAVGDVLTAGDPEPPVGTWVRDRYGPIWTRYGTGWIRRMDGADSLWRYMDAPLTVVKVGSDE